MTTSARRDLGGDEFALTCKEVLRLRPGIAARSLLGLEWQLDERRTEALDLFLGCRADVVGANHRTEATRGGDRLQAGHTGPQHEDLGGGDGPGRGHEHREEARQLLGREQCGVVARHGGLRGECVHGLRTRDTGQKVEREGGDPPLRECLDECGVGRRLQEADDGRPLLQASDFLNRGGLDLADHVRGCVERVGRGGDVDAPCLVGRVLEVCRLSCATLDRDCRAGLHDPRHDVWDHRDAALMRRAF